MRSAVWKPDRPWVRRNRGWSHGSGRWGQKQHKSLQQGQKKSLDLSLIAFDNESRRDNLKGRQIFICLFIYFQVSVHLLNPLISKMIRVKMVTLAGSNNTQQLLSGGGFRFIFTTATRTEPRSAVNRRTGAAGERGGGNGSGSGATKICINFDQTQEAYKSKRSLDLLRSLVVFKLCSYDFLVDRNKEVM